MMATSLLFIIGTTWAQRPMPTSSPEVTAEQFVTAFYKFYLPDEKTKPSLDECLPFLTDDLYKWILKALKAPPPESPEDPQLDFDPFTGSPDDIALKSADLQGEDKKTASVTATFKWREKDTDEIVTLVDVELIKSPNGWLIQDVNYGFSLMEFLKENF